MRNVFFRGSNLFTCFIQKVFARFRKSVRFAEKCSHKIFNFCGLKVKVQEIQLDNQAGNLTWYFRLSLMFYPLYKISNKLPKVVYPQNITIWIARYYNVLKKLTIGRPTRSTSFLAAKIFNILNIIKLVREV